MMEIGTKFKYKSYDKIREALFLEDLGDKIKAIVVGDYKTQGFKVEIDKKDLL